MRNKKHPNNYQKQDKNNVWGRERRGGSFWTDAYLSKHNILVLKQFNISYINYKNNQKF